MAKLIWTAPHTRKGTDLSPADQRRALARFVHRFTRDHKPAWAVAKRPCGRPYPVQFASDTDWLANTLFAVTAAGKLDDSYGGCISSPTWPDGAEEAQRPAMPEDLDDRADAALIDCGTPEAFPRSLRDMADKFRESESELVSAWQDPQAGKVWGDFARILDRAADSAEKALTRRGF